MLMVSGVLCESCLTVCVCLCAQHACAWLWLCGPSFMCVCFMLFFFFITRMLDRYIRRRHCHRVVVALCRLLSSSSRPARGQRRGRAHRTVCVVCLCDRAFCAPCRVLVLCVPHAAHAPAAVAAFTTRRRRRSKFVHLCVRCARKRSVCWVYLLLAVVACEHGFDRTHAHSASHSSSVFSAEWTHARTHRVDDGGTHARRLQPSERRLKLD